jgi:hypothetical protein
MTIGVFLFDMMRSVWYVLNTFRKRRRVVDELSGPEISGDIYARISPQTALLCVHEARWNGDELTITLAIDGDPEKFDAMIFTLKKRVVGQRCFRPRNEHCIQIVRLLGECSIDCLADSRRRIATPPLLVDFLDRYQKDTGNLSKGINWLRLSVPRETHKVIIWCGARVSDDQARGTRVVLRRP